MVIISNGLVNIDAKIFSNTERYDGFTKTNAVIFHVNLYFFSLAVPIFFKKMKSPPANFMSFRSGFVFPAIFLSLFKKKCLCVRKVNCKPFSVDICILKGEAEYKCKCW